MRKIKQTALLFIALLLIPLFSGLVVFAPKVSAATITVTTTADEDDDPGTGCSLYEAIEAANTDTAYGGCPAGSGADTINLPAGVYSTDNPLYITDDLTLLGDPAGGTIIEGGYGLTIDINTSDQVYLVRDITIRNSLGGGIGVFGRSPDYLVTLDRVTVEGNEYSGIDHSREAWIETGSVYITNSLVQNNNSFGVYNRECVYGGSMYITNSMIRDNQDTGVFNYCGHVSLDRVTISGNTSQDSAGGIHNGAYSGDTALLDATNVTVFGNTSASYAGGISNHDQANIINTTIANNQSGVGVGGLTVQTPNDTTIYNTLIANNQGVQCEAFFGDFADAANNLASDDSCYYDGHDEWFNEDPITNIGLASSLADHGGSAPIGSGGLGGNVLTLALLEGSPAINAGNDDYCPEVDERNAGRPSGGTCDVGAYEAHFASATTSGDNGGNGASTPAATLADTGQSTALLSAVATVLLLTGSIGLVKARQR